MAQQIVTWSGIVSVMSPIPARPPLWLVRPRDDGGTDYVSFLPAAGPSEGSLVEIREGSHLPPQMPLLKRRRRLGAEEAEACRRRLQQEGGFRCSEPLF
jgi:hypothetical protein